ncbi:hypothetical protein E3T28_00385 [Cryobacterium sinapicolor]|uniref:Uncharacterized protein n=1 Tax=Cryobacterium sinapicolor TaxID=1259236 RepID=A0ABY2JHI0_9MICO|nr:hypothetical protein [Cryobacterium sinapicolor]TFD05841.1 hypothetical protein E3T28_00385 [Cryobacterium sinapicolor]
MTALTPVLDPMNGLDHRPALPRSVTRASELKLATLLASLHYISVGTCAVSAATWQVRGPRVGVDSVSVLLGYIQRVGDTFEATNLLRPLESRVASTLAQAAESITAAAATK